MLREWLENGLSTIFKINVDVGGFINDGGGWKAIKR